MTLSYTLRLLCVLTLAIGLVLAASQITLALAARWILGALDATTARWRERILYLLQIGPALIAIFIAGALCLPSWLHGETNRESESVSALCLLVAALIALWFASTLFRGLALAFRTRRYARACRRSGQLLFPAGDIPVLAVSDPGLPVGLIGFLRPLILVSSGLLDASCSIPLAAFDLALAHERSHARHRDNWKLLTLAFLPRLHPRLPGGDPFRQPWQNAADWAADDDAVRGDPNRSFLLADALVLAARAANASTARATYICTALTSAGADLAVRVHRLIHPQPSARTTAPSLLVALAAFALLAAAALCTLSPWIYNLSEHLLHLGAA
jgi:hypothetical protein